MNEGFGTWNKWNLQFNNKTTPGSGLHEGFNGRKKVKQSCHLWHTFYTLSCNICVTKCVPVGSCVSCVVFFFCKCRVVVTNEYWPPCHFVSGWLPGHSWWFAISSHEATFHNKCSSFCPGLLSQRCQLLRHRQEYLWRNTWNSIRFSGKRSALSSPFIPFYPHLVPNI